MLEYDQNGKAIYSSGPDQRVTQFSFVPSSSSTAAEDDMAETSRSISGEWQQTSTKRLHKHDVRALAMFPSYSLAPRSSLAPLNPGVAPVLASGGLDMSLVLTSAAQSEGVSKKSNKEQSLVKNPLTKKGKEVFSDAVKVDLGYVPRGYGNDVISIAREKKLVLVRRYRGIALFRIRDMIRRGEEVDGESVPGGWDKVLEMDFQVSAIPAKRVSETRR
jgi:U3 small nucleolar RNA-associated protein 4